jgi:hypothetical protein
MDEQESIKELEHVLTNEVAYRVYILTTFREVQTRLKYLEGLQEKSGCDLSRLLEEHDTCRKDVEKAMKFEETWHWGNRVKRLVDGLKVPILAAVILGLAVWLLYLYVLHPQVQLIRKPVVSQEEVQ